MTASFDHNVRRRESQFCRGAPGARPDLYRVARDEDAISVYDSPIQRRALDVVSALPAPPLRTTPTRAERPASPAASNGADGYLEIDSDPTAELFLDGVDMGPTPLFHHRVRPGQHTLRIEAAGYQTQRVSVQVEAGRTFTKRYKLNPE